MLLSERQMQIPGHRGAPLQPPFSRDPSSVTSVPGGMKGKPFWATREDLSSQMGKMRLWEGQGPSCGWPLPKPGRAAGTSSPPPHSCHRACPGTASTAATKELAQLWRVMTLQERKPYW